MRTESAIVRTVMFAALYPCSATCQRYTGGRCSFIDHQRLGCHARWTMATDVSVLIAACEASGSSQECRFEPDDDHAIYIHDGWYTLQYELDVK
jgi:hypothetical protein